MKIVYAAAFNPKSTNYSQANELEERCELIRYDSKVRQTELGLEGRDSELIDFVTQHKPDMLLIAKGRGMNIRVIHEVNKVCKTALWFMDAVAPSHWNQELRDKFVHCSYVFVDKIKAKELVSKVNPNVHMAYEGFDSTVDKPVDVARDIPVSFIGDPYGHRLTVCNAINAQIFQDVYREEHAKVVSRSYINLNLCTCDCASDRVYKVLATKGLLFSDSWYKMEDILTPNVDFVLVENITDLREKIKHYLTHEDEANLIRESGFKSVQKYSRANWAEKILLTANS